MLMFFMYSLGNVKISNRYKYNIVSTEAKLTEVLVLDCLGQLCRLLRKP